MAAARRPLASGLLLPLALVAIVAGMAAHPAGATVITPTPVPFTEPEQSQFQGAVATFEDDNPSASTTDFTATIDWGDGSPTSAGSIGSSSAAFVVLGTHTYADEGNFTVTVTISDVSPGTGTATTTSPATITEADVLAGTPVTFSAAAGTAFSGTVGNFTDQLTTADPSDFTATINWGDATTSTGTVSGGSGSFVVSGTHTYAGPGTFSVMVTLSDDSPGTATATVTSTANVAASLVTVTADNFTTPEHVAFTGTVATFTDTDTTKTAGNFTASIAWGDGTTTAGNVSGSAGSFSVAGNHTYADEQTDTFTVTVTDTTASAPTASAPGTATVTEHDVLHSVGTPEFSPTAGTPFSGPVATFTDDDTVSTADDFTATINWGDGTTTTGTVSGGSGTFTVSGTHTYAVSGPENVTVTLSDDPPGTATAASLGTVQVAAASVASVPALGPSGLLALALLLAGCGLVVVRRSGRKAA